MSNKEAVKLLDIIASQKDRIAELDAYIQPLEAENERLHKDWAYYSELCTSQQARIGELRGALIEIATQGCYINYQSDDAATCESKDIGQPRADWCNPCRANEALSRDNDNGKN